MSNDVFFYRAQDYLNEIQNELTDFLPELILHLKFLLNCGVFFAANMRGGVLLDVRRRGKPSTWLPRQKLAEERNAKRSQPPSQQRPRCKDGDCSNGRLSSNGRCEQRPLLR